MHYARYLSDIFFPSELVNGDVSCLQTKKGRKTAKNAKKKICGFAPGNVPFCRHSPLHSMDRPPYFC